MLWLATQEICGVLPKNRGSRNVTCSAVKTLEVLREKAWFLLRAMSREQKFSLLRKLPVQSKFKEHMLTTQLPGRKPTFFTEQWLLLIVSKIRHLHHEDRTTLIFHYLKYAIEFVGNVFSGASPQTLDLLIFYRRLCNITTAIFYPEVRHFSESLTFSPPLSVVILHGVPYSLIAS